MKSLSITKAFAKSFLIAKEAGNANKTCVLERVIVQITKFES